MKYKSVCQVPPLLQGDGLEIETIISYPTSMETLDRGDELFPSGKKYFLQVRENLVNALRTK